MFLFLKKLSITSNASRQIFIFKLNWRNNFSFFFQLQKKKSLGGRNTSGRRVIRSKGSVKTPIIWASTNYFYNSNTIGFVSNIYLSPLLQTFRLLLVNANGALFYKPLGRWTTMFSFNYTSQKHKYLKPIMLKPYYLTLLHTPILGNFSFAEIYPHKGAQYSRSSGSASKLLSKNISTHTVLVKLPSGVRKIFSLYSLVTDGIPALKEKKYQFNTKAGYRRLKGCKPIVRGVAMNPVDHPHGGRTKSIKYPRTPWGLTTKFK